MVDTFRFYINMQLNVSRNTLTLFKTANKKCLQFFYTRHLQKSMMQIKNWWLIIHDDSFEWMSNGRFRWINLFEIDFDKLPEIDFLSS